VPPEPGTRFNPSHAQALLPYLAIPMPRCQALVAAVHCAFPRKRQTALRLEPTSRMRIGVSLRQQRLKGQGACSRSQLALRARHHSLSACHSKSWLG
jgi:hypothetical protein